MLLRTQGEGFLCNCTRCRFMEDEDAIMPPAKRTHFYQHFLVKRQEVTGFRG